MKSHTITFYVFKILAAAFMLSLFFTACQRDTASLSEDNIWPCIEKQSKPWVRWWWMGSAVNEKDLGCLLEEYSEKGFGGVEIAPIYGAKGYEDQYVDFLSPRWIELLNYTIAKADSLGMGVDMTTGTGWPFGGPNISTDLAARHLFIQKYELSPASSNIEIVIDDPNQQNVGAELIAVTGYGPGGTKEELIEYVSENHELQWKPESGTWTIYAAFDGRTRQRVKRAAPGGKGFTFDHLSKQALNHYLDRFDLAFKNNTPKVRCFFNDSYELFGASWSQNFLQDFEQRRGYDLALYLRELNGEGNPDTIALVKSDYRETMSDLLIDNFSTEWTAWAHRYGAKTRNQSHGSPANLLDVYASVDVPEIETFGATHFDIPDFFWDTAHVKKADHNPLFLKLAASAANLTGKNLVSCETFTWLGEHFRVPLSQCKPEAEQVMLSGVNHIFYHGATYSPEQAQWPGWLFYASTNFAPSNSFWPHVQGLNKYITRCQSVLQSTRPDNDILVYWPVYDVWNNPEGMERMMTVHSSKEWLIVPSVENLLKEGYAFDFVSDSLLKTLTVDGEKRVTAPGGNQYKAVVVPDCTIMPLATLNTLMLLAESGVPVIMHQMPGEVPGLKDMSKRNAQMKSLLEDFSIREIDDDMAIAEYKGTKIYLTHNFEKALGINGIKREVLTDRGLKFIRKKSERGTYYYLVNHTSSSIDETIAFNATGKHTLIMDPETGDYGRVVSAEEGEQSFVRIQCRAGEACFVLFSDWDVSGIDDWHYERLENQEIFSPGGSWEIDFIGGGPELPESRTMDSLQYWTNLEGDKIDAFSGTARYSTTFYMDKLSSSDYLLNLGKVAHSARVLLNGQDLGVLWSEPFVVNVGKYLHEGENTLQIEVANLMANRIRYMDQQGMEWRNYHEINFVNIRYKSFDASGWDIMASGLAGPVQLIPVSEAQSSPEVKLKNMGEKGLMFNFGSEDFTDNTIGVSSDQIYNKEDGFGFDLWTNPEVINTGDEEGLQKNALGSDKPFYFSVKLPEGNYEVTIWIGDPHDKSVTTVKAESRRLMVERSTTEAAEVKEHTFMVNVRSPRIAGTDSVILKKREYDALNWDDKLTLEFNGDNPFVYGVRIKPAKSDIKTIFLAGNSTVVDQEYEPYAAWGQMIPRFLNNDVVVANYAFSGASLASFKGRMRLDKVMSLMKPGDYVFIEFGHNDQKRKGEGIGPWQSFSDYLREFISLAKEKGGHPILVTPMQRRSFDEQGQIASTHGDYPAAVRKVAETENVPLIDLNAMSKILYEAWGPEESRKAFVQYPAHTFRGQDKKLEDNTHFNNYGAYQIALCQIKGIRDLGLELTNYLKPETPEIDLNNPISFSDWKLKHSPRSTNQKPDGN
ncbi:glycosyl hydrolase [Marinilabilia salmonicolor]|uniref:Lysophospholipase L1-like esterase n=1 Tax=Marinilabilia salmonicolor TaxID=989 RepID=A0A368UWT5_9BACT|nr:glycosyl hydrolase [Marinilabilia salmonicolor]RCW32545.1 lysophospholipase L1-like esterase [Marinilabilia salmonicolor]